MRRVVRQHIVDAEKNVRETFEPDPEDPDNEQAVLHSAISFGDQVRREFARASGDAAIHLHAVLEILKEDRRFNWPSASE